MFTESIYLSLKTASVATILALPFAILFGYILAKCEFPGKLFLDCATQLPIVLPPVAVGYFLLLIFGAKGPVGHFFYQNFGIRIAFTWVAATIAAFTAGLPLFIRSVKLAMEMIDPKIETAAINLGTHPLAVFFKITLPLATPGILSGALLCFTRALGEFGATIVFAGNIEGETRTIPLEIFNAIQRPGGEKQALFLALLTIGISLSALIISNFYFKSLEKYRVKHYNSSLK